LYTHVYYSAKKASGIREDLYAKVALLKQRAEAAPEKSLCTAGGVVLISNDISDAL
jgi:hypothetical protein